MLEYHVRWLGLVPYQLAWDLQAELAGKIAVGELPPTLLLLEHPHIYTFGRRGHASNLVWTKTELEHRGVQVLWVDRGGDVTYHGPGQLVGYPLIPLRLPGTPQPATNGSIRLPPSDYIGYLRKLEQVIILALQQFDVHARRLKTLTGVWVNGSKIAAIGVKVDAAGVTRHGFALNVAPDMSYWDGIIGCGLEGYSVTSLSRLLPEPPSMPQVIRAIIDAFEQVFEVRCVKDS